MSSSDNTTQFCKYKYVVEKMKTMVSCSGASPSQVVHNLLVQAAQIEKNMSSQNIIGDVKRDGR